MDNNSKRHCAEIRPFSVQTSFGEGVPSLQTRIYEQHLNHSLMLSS